MPEITETERIEQKTLAAGLKFGDIVINHWAGEQNPHRQGVFIRHKYSHRQKMLEFTDMKGNFWQQYNDGKTRLEKAGTILKVNPTSRPQYWPIGRPGKRVERA